MSDEILSLDDLTCPHCGHLTDDATSTDPEHPDDLPRVGDATICRYCAGVGVYTEDAIRKATAEELAVLRTSDRFLSSLFTATLHVMLDDHAEDPSVIEFTHPGHDEDHPHPHHATVIGVGIDSAGHPHLETSSDLPDGFRAMLSEAMYRIKVSRMAEEIQHWVTQEVANHVLSVYGNEQASMPSLTTGALISLIRLCHEADDQMMSNLNDVEDFHGYVIAVSFLAEQGPSGLEMLEQIAGLRPVKNAKA